MTDPIDPVEPGPDPVDPGPDPTSEVQHADVAGVNAANDAFYEAHEARDLAAMELVWGRGDVVCIHPGWPILRGWETVRESWARIFDGPGRNQFINTNSSVTIVGDVAWVTLDENLVDSGSTGTIAATNVFVNQDGGWKLMLHQGGPVFSNPLDAQ